MWQERQETNPLHLEIVQDQALQVRSLLAAQFHLECTAERVTSLPNGRVLTLTC